MKTSTYLKMLLCLLIASTAIGQKAETPDFRYDVGAKINEMTITQGGPLVVATNDGLVGIKSGSNDILFNFTDYGRVKPEELNFIPNAPYVTVGQTGFGGMTTKTAVIDYMSGKVLFSTEKNGWKAVSTSNVLMPNNKLIISGQRRASEKYAMGIAIYDLITGEQISFFKFKGGQAVCGRSMLIGDELMVPTTKGIMKINMNSGNVSWQNDLKNASWMAKDADNTQLYAFTASANGSNTKIHKIDMSSGNLLWEDPQKVKGGVVNFEILPQGIAVVSNVDNSGKKGLGKLASSKSQSKIYLLDTNSGADLWDKSPKTKGYVSHLYVEDDGILFAVASGGVNKISFDGQAQWK
ncbi:MAG: PQQ-binding-like beta-propeller repeat protein, partial [Flavobacteriaceae bacterium]|nr:PQQ-binding-like beta-propeller repeat protein [Flavobacteriaceae bacterium]